MMDDDKWWWPDEQSDPLSLPRLDAKLKPIVAWPEVEPAPAPPRAESPQPPAAEKAAAPPTVENPRSESRRHIPPSVLKAIVLHLEGKLEEAIQELEIGL